MKYCGYLLLLITLMLCACSEQQQTPEQMAGQAAQLYYDRLLAGDTEGFLSGKADVDSLPTDYRVQLLKACEQYKQQLDALHGGVASVTVSNVRNDSLQQMMQAFLLLNFKDSTKEEIIVPMVQRGVEWKMR